MIVKMKKKMVEKKKKKAPNVAQKAMITPRCVYMLCVHLLFLYECVNCCVCVRVRLVGLASISSVYIYIQNVSFYYHFLFPLFRLLILLVLLLAFIIVFPLFSLLVLHRYKKHKAIILLTSLIFHARRLLCRR